MSGFSASAMLTPYLPTNQRISRVVIDPPLAPATRPAKVVRRCLGSRYCGKTLRRSDTVQPRIEYRSLYRAGASGEWFLPLGMPPSRPRVEIYISNKFPNAQQNRAKLRQNCRIL